MIHNILFTFTFIYGVLALLTYTKIFEKKITGCIDSLFWKELPLFFRWLDVVIFFGSLAYQVNYWLIWQS